MEIRRCVTGQGILAEGGWLEHDLIEAVRSRELVPINRLDRTEITEDVDPCLYCDGGKEPKDSAPPMVRDCSTRNIHFSLEGVERPLQCSDAWSREALAERLLAATFYADEVEKYARKYQLAPLGQDSATGQTVGAMDGTDEDPKGHAERLLAQGLDPGQVMLSLVEKFKKMPQWKAAGLALRLPVVGLDQFEKDRLKSMFQRRTKAFR